MTQHLLHERTGFDIGWDYAFYGIPFPPNLYQASGQLKCIVDGYTQGVDRFGKRGRAPQFSVDARYRSKWMNLRISAFKRNRIVAPQVTPEYLSRIDEKLCPVSRIVLTHGTGSDSDASIERINNDGGYAPGNLCVMSVKANHAKGHKSFRQVLHTALSMPPGSCVHGLNNVEWARLACLSSFSTGEEDADLVGGLPLLCLAPIDCILTHQIQHLQHVCSAYLLPRCDPRTTAKIDHAFASLKDKKVNRSLGKFTQACKYAYNHAFLASERPRVPKFVVGDAWRNAVLYGYWEELRDRIADRTDVIVRALSTRPNHGLSGRECRDDYQTWGLESNGHIPAAEW